MSKPPNRNKYDLQGCLTEIFGEQPENKKNVSAKSRLQGRINFMSLFSLSPLFIIPSSSHNGIPRCSFRFGLPDPHHPQRHR